MILATLKLTGKTGYIRTRKIPDQTRDNDDPTQPDPQITGRGGFTRGYGRTASRYWECTYLPLW